MKILLTTDWFTPAVNGVVTSVLNLRKGLEERGHEVRILTLSHSSRSYVQDSVYYICSMGIGAVYPNARVGAAIPLKILKELLFWKLDIVHSNCEFSTFPAACHIAEKANAPLLHTYHTVYENYTHYFSPSRAWGKVVARHFSAGLPAAPTVSSLRLKRLFPFSADMVSAVRCISFPPGFHHRRLQIRKKRMSCGAVWELQKGKRFFCFLEDWPGKKTVLNCSGL